MRNEYTVDGEVTRITLKRKKGAPLFALIDTADLPLVDAITTGSWCVGTGNYVVSSYGHRLHSALMGTPPRVFDVVDHINHDPLDNRRSCNLRWLTRAENCKNVSEHKRTRMHWRPDINRVFKTAVYPPTSIHNQTTAA